jgi:16S rRNA (guanine966-N2)-methyltransferase
MRVVAGLVGGVALHAPRSNLRPTMDRVKAAIFSSLVETVQGAHVLDLFAGTGSLGIEALSRGAAHVTFVDNDRGAVELINRNLSKTRLEGTIHSMDVFRFLDKFAKPESFDLIFADPPYAKKSGERDFAPELLASGSLRRALSPQGIFVLEHLPGAKLPLGGIWEPCRQKRYGATEVAFLRPSEKGRHHP